MFSLKYMRLQRDIVRKNAILLVISFTILLSGCTTTNIDISDHTTLIGTWSMIEDMGDTSFRIFYEFHNNDSFFTGVQNMSSLQYDFTLWGRYSKTDSRINLTVVEPYSTTNLKYSISEDGKTLLLYYEDDINFDVLTRE